MTDKNTPLVSVVIAFLNEEKFLAEAVESVLYQDYPAWELLLIDDGSTDGSTRIARNFAALFPHRIFYYDHEGHRNQGLSASRNAGIKRANGSLVAFLDADDVWLPRKLSNQVRIFLKHPEIAMVAEASEYWYSWNDPTKSDKNIAVGAPPDKVYRPEELVRFLYPLSKGAAPCPSGLMVTKAALQKVRGFEESFRGKYALYEDQAFLHKIYLKEKVYVSSDCNNKYRQRQGSIVQQVQADGHYHIVRKHFLEYLQNYLKLEQIKSPAVLRLLKKAFARYHHPQRYFLTHTLPEKLSRLLRRSLRKLTPLQWQNSPF